MNASPQGPDWRELPVDQQPAWPDRALHDRVLGDLAAAAPLVAPRECDRLRGLLAAVARGEMFLLQGGPCAETFAEAAPIPVARELRTLEEMAGILGRAGGRPVVQVGRLAGQYAKPRSSPTEQRAGAALPVYRGDAVNGVEFTAEARTPDSRRLLRMYEAAATTLDAVREHRNATGGEVFTSHEGLLLDYEDALTRPDGSGRRYATSAHLLWIGERTRGLTGAHVAYFSRIHNPIAVKIGPSATADSVLEYVERLDPDREPGRLAFTVRVGADRIRDRLPALVEKVAAEAAQVVWVCDPMHGNTFEAANGYKTRHFDHIVDEVAGFFEVHRALGTQAGGIHIELTGADVTECVGEATRSDRRTCRCAITPPATHGSTAASRWNWPAWSRRCWVRGAGSAREGDGDRIPRRAGC